MYKKKSWKASIHGAPTVCPEPGRCSLCMASLSWQPCKGFLKGAGQKCGDRGKCAAVVHTPLVHVPSTNDDSEKAGLGSHSQQADGSVEFPKSKYRQHRSHPSKTFLKRPELWGSKAPCNEFHPPSVQTPWVLGETHPVNCSNPGSLEHTRPWAGVRVTWESHETTRTSVQLPESALLPLVPASLLHC